MWHRDTDSSFSEVHPDGTVTVAASGRYTVQVDGPEGRQVKVAALPLPYSWEDEAYPLSNFKIVLVGT